jgi:hypothetical protein
MTIPDPYRQQLAEFPAPLRALVEAELQAGNSIVAIENGFPAAPCGASVKLAKAVQDERRRSTARWSSTRATTPPTQASSPRSSGTSSCSNRPCRPSPRRTWTPSGKIARTEAGCVDPARPARSGSGPELGRSMIQERVADEQAPPAPIPKGALTSRRPPPARFACCTSATTVRRTRSSSRWSAT